MSRIVDLQIIDSELGLTVRDRELLLEVLDAAIDETLTAAAFFDKQTEIRHGYNQRLNTLLALFQRIMSSGEREVLPKSRSATAEYR
jgi:hypothetical protein